MARRARCGDPVLGLVSAPRVGGVGMGRACPIAAQCQSLKQSPAPPTSTEFGLKVPHCLVSRRSVEGFGVPQPPSEAGLPVSLTEATPVA